MKTETFPITVSEAGVSAKIRKVTKTRQGESYDSYVVDYFLLGRRRQVWRADLDDAKAVARDACIRIANGNQEVLNLSNQARLIYLRASESLAGTAVPLDVACRDYAEALAILSGRAGVVQACREWMRTNAVQLPKVKVRDAADEFEDEAEVNKRSANWVRVIKAVMGRFCADVDSEVQFVTPDIISRWLSGLPLAERTRRNCRDVLGMFCRYCIRRGYLAKGADWLDGVQNYSAKKFGAIEIYTPDEMTALLRCAEDRDAEMVTFLAIGAFAELRHSEIARLDWQQVDLNDGFIEILPVDGTKSEGRRRLVPIKPNLKAWLSRHSKRAGPVCPRSSVKRLLRIAELAQIEWKHNALRHSGISYRVAECGDIARVADEAGNSTHVIKTHYLRRVKPAQAVEWFSIIPAVKRRATRKLVQLEAAA